VSPFDSVTSFLSVDSGFSYELMGNASQFNLDFVVPFTLSDNCLVRIDNQRASNKQFEIKANYSIDFVKFINKNRTIYVNGKNYVALIDKSSGLTYREHKSKKRVEQIRINKQENQFALVFPKKIKLYDISTFTSESEIYAHKILGIGFGKLHKRRITAASFGPKGKYFATADQEGKLKVWNLNSAKLQKKLSPFTVGIKHVGFLEYDSILYVTSRKELKLYRLSDFKEVQKFRFYREIVDIKVYDDDDYMIVAESDGTITVIDLLTQLVLKKEEIIKKAKSVSIDPKGDRIAVLNKEGISFFSYPDLKFQFKIQEEKQIKSIDFNDQATQIVSANRKDINIWSTYKRYRQTDISDSVFSIVGGLPKAKVVHIGPAFKNFSASKFVLDYIYNPNKYSIEIKSIFFEDFQHNKFNLVSGFPPYVLKARSGHQVEFSYVSHEIGKDSAIVNIVTTGDTIRVPIYGETINLPFEIYDKLIDFGTLLPTQKKELKTKLLKNVSNIPLEIEKLNFVGGNPKNFEIPTDLVGKIIKPGSMLFFDATYFAFEAGISTLGLKIKFKGYQQRATITLYGYCKSSKHIILKGKLRDLLTYEPIVGQTELFDVQANKSIVFIPSDSAGNYNIRLAMDRIHKITASSPNYSKVDTLIDLREITADSIIYHDFLLDPDYTLLNKVTIKLMFDT
ncbi:MAG: hypothetical protein KAI79_10315, partial [Bacteroidales bacterium]|nr:hypothetical protein [Bacteroidales bacterium]